MCVCVCVWGGGGGGGGLVLRGCKRSVTCSILPLTNFRSLRYKICFQFESYNIRDTISEYERILNKLLNLDPLQKKVHL